MDVKIIDFFNKHQWILPVGSVAVAWEWFKSPLDLPHWVTVILAMGTVLFLLLVFFVWKNAYGRNSYTADEIDGYRWVWNYDNVGKIEDLSLCCNQCGTQLLKKNFTHLRSSEGYEIGNRYGCNCSNSKCRKLHEFTGDIESLKKDVEVNILAKLSNGTWKTVLKENKHKEHEFKKYFS